MRPYITSSITRSKYEQDLLQQLQAKYIFQSSNALLQLKEHYILEKNTIGHGSFGKVYLAKSKQNEDQTFAVKQLSKSRLCQEQLAVIRDEISILSMFHHPNIVRYVESFEDKGSLYIVMENCSRGTLMDHLESLFRRNETMKEKDVAVLMFKLLRAIHHIHSNGIVHRDLKPENIMFDQDGTIKIIDFGLSKIQNDFFMMRTKVGSLVYTAPEILQDQPYDHQIDLWSLGVIMYLCLSGSYPFDGKGMEENICKNQHIFIPIHKWTEVSFETKEIINKMLVKSPYGRISSSQALKHTFFRQNGVNDELTKSDFEIDLKLLTFIIESEALPPFIRLTLETFADNLNINQLKYLSGKLKQNFSKKNQNIIIKY
eukprot:403369865